MSFDFAGAATRIHQDDEQMKAWTRCGRGVDTVHSTFGGWELRKTRDGRAWTIHKPGGAPADRWTWPTLIAAKLRAVDYGADA